MHHRLLDVGLSQRQVVNLIYLVCFVLGAIAIVLSRPGGPHLL
jgi:UDP-N-acetylmuramyl pentapeptide phosphotransferase/UDP-N-acetylglucosamine-1-phosphate transferase